MSEMDDQTFIGYVELHSQTDRALFAYRDVIRFYELARSKPKQSSTAAISGTFVPMYYRDIREHIDRARQYIKARGGLPATEPVANNIIHVNFRRR